MPENSRLRRRILVTYAVGFQDRSAIPVPGLNPDALKS